MDVHDGNFFNNLCSFRFGFPVVIGRRVETGFEPQETHKSKSGENQIEMFVISIVRILHIFIEIWPIYK